MGAYFRNFVVFNKLSKAAIGKTNKACDSAASFFKITTLRNICHLSEIFNTKVGNIFELLQVQQKRNLVKCFYFIKNAATVEMTGTSQRCILLVSL